MGLDVYLYKCADVASHQEWEKKREAKSESIKVVGSNYDPYRKAMAAWDEENPDPSPEEKIEIDSRVYPGHLFKIGYCRSSYNGGGLERVVGNATGKGLHWIFESDDEYIVRPDWHDSLRRAREARDAYAAYVKQHGALRVMAVTANQFRPEHGAKSEEEALATFLAQKARGGGGSYGCLDGDFWLDKPLSVKAAIPGVHFGQRGVYLIWESDEPEWYTHALEIVAEMCEWVISQPDAQKYYLHWSG